MAETASACQCRCHYNPIYEREEEGKRSASVTDVTVDVMLVAYDYVGYEDINAIPLTSLQ